MITRFSTRMALCGLVVLGALGAVVASGSSATAAGGPGTASDTVWLCQPGQAVDPCTYSPASTTVTATGSTSVTPSSAPATASEFDCFYVYGTVSKQNRENSNLKVQKAEIDTAVAEASRFSQACRVWAPMYRQRTVGSLAKGLGGDPTADEVAYQSFLSGWKDYLAHDNDGRPIILIGHSQGAAMLIRLLRSQFDANAQLRKRLVVAIILGGNVQVPTGKTVGGSFQHIPTCTSLEATGCVIAYSTFGTTPPPTSNFGRPGQGVSLQSDQTASSGQQVACVNPVTFSSASGPLLPYFPSVTSPVPGVNVGTPWVAFPGLYTARCLSRGGATWLQVTPTAVPADPRPLVAATLGPDWGYHLDDVNLALGNLVSDVAREEAAYKG